MLSIRINECPEELLQGIRIIADKYSVRICPDGEVFLDVVCREGNLEVSLKNSVAVIEYDKKIHFFRGFGILIERLLKNEKEFAVSEEVFFKTNGFMIDSSSRSVMRPKAIKSFLLNMAVMGLNSVLLCMDDTYPMEGEPYFGYMCSKYTVDELRDCDDYADIFGIEIIPCIQVLGHLLGFLRWNETKKYADNGGVLLCDDDAVDALIENMITSASAPFRTKKIHLGMDETYGLGEGAYLAKHGRRDALELFTSHLQKVCKMAEKHSLEPMIWGDMFFYKTSSTQDWLLPDMEMPENIVKSIPENVNLVHWDYFHDDKEFYKNFLQRYRNMGKEPIFAGGVWLWTSMSANFTKTLNVTHPALAACKEMGVKEVYLTQWSGDVGYYPALFGLQLYAEHGYNKDFCEESFKERLKFCTGISYEDFMKLDALDNVTGKESEVCEPYNPSYCLFWQDIMMGLYDYEIGDIDYESYYKELSKKFDTIDTCDYYKKIIFEYPKYVSKVLEIKSLLGIKLKNAYESNNLDTLRVIANETLPKLYDLVEKTRRIHYEQWVEVSKPMGWEDYDLKYGFMLARIKTAEDRINGYLNGKYEQLEELCVQRLPYYGKNEGMHALHWSGDLITKPRVAQESV